MNNVNLFIRKNRLLKLLYIIFIYWPLYFFSGVFKRNNKTWLITCHHGFVDNSKYFYLFYHDYLNSNYHVNLTWLAHKKEDKETLNKLGFKHVVLKRSIRGVYLSLIAKVYISPYGIEGFYQSISKNALLVNLWHGVGIKNMKFKGEIEPLIEKILSTPFSKILYPSVYRSYDLFLSTSELMTDHFSECFAMNKRNFFISEYPRCKPLVMTENDLQSFIEKYEPESTVKLAKKITSYNQCFIYMPTWRDDNPDFLTQVGIDWEAINITLSNRNYLLIIKVHPSCATKGLSEHSNILVLNPKIDVYPILSLTDCLITDYSSIYFDYLLTGNKIALFTFDYNEYMENCRDFAYPYDENMAGFRIDNTLDFKCFFEDYENIDFNTYIPIQNRVKNKFWTSNVSFYEFLEKIKREII